MSTQDLLANAMRAHQAGRLDEARVGYQRVLRKQPSHPDALHFFGMWHLQRKDLATAEQLMRRSLAYAPRNEHAWNNLGNVLVMLGRAAEAQAAYQRALEIAPTMADAAFNLGLALRGEHDFDGATRHLRQSIEHAPRMFRAYESLGMLHYMRGQLHEAADIYRRWAAVDPENPLARHMAAATSGTAVPERADDNYVTALFDQFAKTFDTNLDKLGYRAPELVSHALAREVGSERKLDLLDAGCGTGLCGPLVRAHCRRLVGVDLSAAMIELAHARGGYDELLVQELSQCMRERPDTFDAIIAADTLVYFGALEEPCAAAHRALRAAGLLIFTVEALTDESADPHRLNVHGRYAHRESYVRGALEASGFALLSIAPDRLRRELGEDVIGYVVVARKQ